MNEPILDRTCTRCGKGFRGEAWKRLCYTCWRQQRGKPDVHVYQPSENPTLSQLSMELTAVRDELKLKTELIERMKERHRQLMLENQQITRENQQLRRLRHHHPALPHIPGHLLRFIRQKCHPDKCQDTATANEVLQWLNRLPS